MSTTPAATGGPIELRDDVPAAEPAVVTGVLIGYARVSTTAQLLDRQLRALDDVGCTKVFSDQLSGRDADRPELQACLTYLRAGDTLVVPSLDRLSRSLQDLITLVAQLRRRGIGFRSLHEALDTTTPGGRLVFHVFAALAESDLIKMRTREGMKVARAKGRLRGKKPKLSPRQEAHLVELHHAGAHTSAELAELFSVARSTVYRAIGRARVGETA